MKRIIGILLFSAVLVLFTTCSEPIDFVNEVETEVKIANDLFLEIESVNPGESDTGVNPGRDIEIQFDRSINLNSVNENTLQIIKPDDSLLPWKNPRFNNTSKILYVEPNPYLEDTTGYTIKVNGIIGSDNSELQEERVWSFVTGVAPVGSITVASNNPKSIFETTLDGDLFYTDSNIISYSVEGNGILATQGGEFHVSNVDLSQMEDNELGALSPWIDYTNPANRTSASFEIPLNDGYKIVYAVFRYYDSGSSAYVYSKVKQALMYLDTNPPSLELGSTRYARSSFYIQPVNENSVYAYLWSGSGLTYTSPSSRNTYVSAGYDDLYSVQLDVWDKAGNSYSDTFTLVWDTIAPTVTSVIIDSNATFSLDTTVNVDISFTDTTPVVSPSANSYSIELWDTDSGYQGFQSATGWSMTESITFNTGHNDDNLFVYVHVKDPAGNLSGWGNDSIRVDTVAPSSPKISTTTTIITTTALRWDWNSGGGGFGYEYQYNSGSWNATNQTYYTATANSSYGKEYRVAVRERDEAGNWSPSSSHDISYYPISNTYLEPDRSATGVSRTTGLDWPNFYEVGGTLVDGYYVYIWSGTSSIIPKDATFFDVSSSSLPNQGTLPGITRINWAYKPYSIVFTRKTIISTSPSNYFTTASR